MKCVAVTGATGLIGRHLVAALRARGDAVVALSRHPQRVGDVEVTVWDPLTGMSTTGLGLGGLFACGAGPPRSITSVRPMRVDRLGP